MQCCKSVVLVFISWGWGVAHPLHPSSRSIRTQDFTALFSDIVSAVISNACRTALALANFDLGFDS